MRISRRWWRRWRPLDCAEVGRVLQTYLDAELDAADADLVAEHLEACLHCGMAADTYDRIRISLASLSASEPSSAGTAGLDPDALRRLREFSDQLAAGNPGDT